MFRSTFFAVMLITATSTVSAQNPYVLEIYGDGVHAFHRGEINRAKEQFDKAINNGSRDPRVYYYRALTSLQYGDQASADQDIRTGVTFEMQGLGTYDIGRALERIQGPQRIQFEEQRLDLKLALGSRPLQAPAVQPYMDPSVMDERPLADELPAEGPALDPFTDDEEPSDPTDLDLDETMPEEPPAETPEEAGAEDPFGEDMAEPAEAPADESAGEEDPFGMDAGEEDPFSEPSDAGADDDPFGSSEPDDDPFADEPATDSPDDDPFG